MLVGQYSIGHGLVPGAVGHSTYCVASWHWLLPAGVRGDFVRTAHTSEGIVSEPAVLFAAVEQLFVAFIRSYTEKHRRLGTKMLESALVENHRPVKQRRLFSTVSPGPPNYLRTLCLQGTLERVSNHGDLAGVRRAGGVASQVAARSVLAAKFHNFGLLLLPGKRRHYSDRKRHTDIRSEIPDVSPGYV